MSRDPSAKSVSAGGTRRGRKAHTIKATHSRNKGSSTTGRFSQFPSVLPRFCRSSSSRMSRLIKVAGPSIISSSSGLSATVRPPLSPAMVCCDLRSSLRIMLSSRRCSTMASPGRRLGSFSRSWQTTSSTSYGISGTSLMGRSNWP